MSTIDIFSRIELPNDKVFSCLLETDTLLRCSSLFFKQERLNSKGSKIETGSYFSQKCIFLDFLNLFYTVKEIIPNEKIVFQFDGIIKGLQTFYIVKDDTSSILREKLEFSLFNNFSFTAFDFLLTLFFYVDSYIKHLRLKSLLYKETQSVASDIRFITKEFSAIRSYILVDSDIGSINSIFDDLRKFALMLSPFIKIEDLTTNKEFKEGQEFNLDFIIPFIPKLSCHVSKNDMNKVIISFSNSIFSGKNIWTILPCENQLLIEHSIEINEMFSFFRLIWLIVGNTLIRNELICWNNRLKEVIQKSSLSKLLEAPAS